MKIRIALMTLALVIPNTTFAVPLGAFKAVDAFCTNSEYKFSADEQAYIDSLRGKGSCVDGKIMSPPCYEDYYVFEQSNRARLVTRSQDLPGTSCIITTEATYTESKPGVLDMILAPSKSRVENTNPNAELSCTANGEGGKAVVQYRLEGANILLFVGSDKECGDYLIKFVPVPQTP